MALINPIKYTIYDQVIPRDQTPPMIEISGDAMAYGTIELQLPISSISSVVAYVYQVAPPTTAINQWSRILPNLYNMVILDFSYLQLASGNVQITWQFNPQSLTPFHKECFSIEFFVNTNTLASTAQYAPKVIVKINNPAPTSADWPNFFGGAGGNYGGGGGGKGYADVNAHYNVSGAPGVIVITTDCTGYQTGNFFPNLKV